jgi:hypothetical protein
MEAAAYCKMKAMHTNSRATVTFLELTVTCNKRFTNITSTVDTKTIRPTTEHTPVVHCPPYRNIMCNGSVSFGSADEQMTGFCEYGDEASNSKKCGESQLAGRLLISQ